MARKYPNVLMVHVDALSMDGPKVVVVTQLGKVAITPKAKQSLVPEWTAQEAVQKKIISWMQYLPPGIKDTGLHLGFFKLQTSCNQLEETLDAAWKELYAAPLQINLSSLLQLVPNFHKSLFHQEWVHRATVSSAKLDDAPPFPVDRIIDAQILEFLVQYHGTYIDRVPLDGGAEVNIITQAACQKYGLTD